MSIEVVDGKCRLGPPHADEELWLEQLCAAFGTTSPTTARTFLSQLAGLCTPAYDAESGLNLPALGELLTGMNMVGGLRPRTEAEAALAIQAVAVHLMTMRIATHTAPTMFPQPQNAAMVAKLARTYAGLIAPLTRPRGGTSRQYIVVRQERHDHRHLHIDREHQNYDNQPYGPVSLPVDPSTSCLDADGPERRGGRSTVPRPNAARNTLPMPGDAEQAAMPHPRRSGGQRRSEGRKERGLADRCVDDRGHRDENTGAPTNQEC